MIKFVVWFIVKIKDTKEPVWIVSCGDEGGSWWEVNRVPEFYKNQSKTKE